MIGAKRSFSQSQISHSIAYGASVVGSLPTLSTLVPLSAGLRCKDNALLHKLYRFAA